MKHEESRKVRGHGNWKGGGVAVSVLVQNSQAVGEEEEEEEQQGQAQVVEVKEFGVRSNPGGASPPFSHAPPGCRLLCAVSRSSEMQYSCVL
jgi:hypothetical protein